MPDPACRASSTLWVMAGERVAPGIPDNAHNRSRRDAKATVLPAPVGETSTFAELSV